MKKALIVIIILALLLIPIKTGYKDGGTTSYRALTYEIIKYHRIANDGAPNNYEVGTGIKILGFEVYKNTSVVNEN